MPNENPKVLIAEDNPGLARVLSFKFAVSGFEPVTCGDGGEAWEAFCASKISAVVSDHEMPVMSGLDLITRVREMDDRVPCFLVTGRQLELSRDPRVARLNVEQVFGKPFSPGTVVSAVADAIERIEGRPASIADGPIPGVTFNQVPSQGITGAGA